MSCRRSRSVCGKLNKVTFAQPPQPLRYFYLDADDEAGEPYTV